MRLTPLITTFLFVLAFAIAGARDLQAATPIAAPAQTLAHQVASLASNGHVTKADFRFHLYIGPRHRYYRPYYRRKRYYRRRRHGRCGYWRKRCIRNWGYRNKDYYGCMRYHDCR
jgi:hypothetical protein